ncbi:hypothetical protein [Paraburkholderia caribensis]|uniref:hypothetical protein n=1 Tax=Paraburkholderia caribensis TaxID=75105 RepID=UPI001CC663F2|nr:hypothetical protein [Paraburkholderia caribensis]
MVREKQLSLCFEPLANDVQQACPSATGLRSAAIVHCLKQYKEQRQSVDDANSIRLAEKIARKVKYF